MWEVNITLCDIKPKLLAIFNKIFIYVFFGLPLPHFQDLAQMEETVKQTIERMNTETERTADPTNPVKEKM